MSEVRAEVERFLALLDAPPGDEDDDRRALTRALDRLAVAMHSVAYTFDDREHADPPAKDYAEMRAQVERRFPWLGPYNAALAVTVSIGEGTCGVGDSVDDVADIALDLAAARWRWDHTSDDDALWHLQFTFDHHWGQHLRSLQLFLWCDRVGW